MPERLRPQGLDMAAFFKNLRTGGTLRNFDGKATGALLDIYGNPVAGKRLSDFLYRTELDQFKIDHGKCESEKRRLEAARKTAADILLERVRIYTMTGGIFANQSPGEEINFWLDWLSTDFNISLSDRQLERFLALYERLNRRWPPDRIAPRNYVRFTARSLPRAELTSPRRVSII